MRVRHPFLQGFLLLGLLLVPGLARAADMPLPWSELVPGGGVDVRAVTAPGMACPKVVADGKVLPGTTRGTPDADYPIQVCVAHAPESVRHITADGLPVPAPPHRIQRIVVIGDTGCRLKGKAVQACNSPSEWPFASVALRAAAQKPDLVIHVGDYHYRETPCPEGNPGCAGSPFGDNWAVWKADFFTPATPLLAAAPWVLVRGNHEICSRGGHGWAHVLDPHPGDAACTDDTAPYALHLDRLTLLMLDGSNAADDKADPAQVADYRAQLQTLLAHVPAHSWLLTHRPVWSLVQGVPGLPAGTGLNLTEQAAIRGLVPPGLDMAVSGHVHSFMSYEFGPARPAQLVVGDSGDMNDAITQPDMTAYPIDGMKPRRAFGLGNYGYVVLDRAADGTSWNATVRAVDDHVLARCHIAGRLQSCVAAK